MFFTTKALREAASSYDDTMKMYLAQQNELVREVVSICKFLVSTACCQANFDLATTYTPIMDTLDNILAHLDVVIR